MGQRVRVNFLLLKNEQKVTWFEHFLTKNVHFLTLFYHFFTKKVSFFTRSLKKLTS
jgi:hypothetical protein